MRTLLIFLALALTGCVTTTKPAVPADEFFARLSALCGKAFEGRIASLFGLEGDAAFAGKRLVMHVRECSANTIRIPFHVGENRSRTWVVTRTVSGLRLKHDHRHEDGSEDEVTQYGGDSVSAGTAQRQQFPADQFSRDSAVRRNNLPALTNVWAMEVEPGRTFSYEVRRSSPNRLFRVDFDLRRPVAAPPAPWGSR